MAEVTTAPLHTTGAHSVSDNYLTNPKGLWSWLTTIDHKRIGLMYLAFVLFAFLLGGIFALLVRLELLTPKEALQGMDPWDFGKNPALHEPKDPATDLN